MESNLIHYWCSDEKKLVTLTRTEEPKDLYNQFIKNHIGKPVTLLLEDYLAFDLVLLGGNKKVVAIRKHPFFDWIIINASSIIGIATP